MKNDAFRKAKVNYSIRLIKKFVDAQRVYGNDWRDFNITYQKLEAACQLSDIENSLITDTTEITVRKPKKARLVKKSSKKTVSAKKSDKVKSEPKKNSIGNYINPKTGKEYSTTMQIYYKKLFA